VSEGGSRFGGTDGRELRTKVRGPNDSSFQRAVRFFGLMNPGLRPSLVWMTPLASAVVGFVAVSVSCDGFWFGL